MIPFDPTQHIQTVYGNYDIGCEPDSVEIECVQTAYNVRLTDLIARFNDSIDTAKSQRSFQLASELISGRDLLMEIQAEET